MTAIILQPDDQPNADLSTFVETPLSKNPAAVYISSLASHHTRRNTRRYLNQIAEMLTNGAIKDADQLRWGALRVEHTEAIRARLAGSDTKYAHGTANVMLSALRGVLKKAWRLGQMNAEDYQLAIDISNVKGNTLPAGRDLKSNEIEALMKVCVKDPTAAGIRDFSIVAILWSCGLRRAELAALQLADVDVKTGKITVTHGKGNKARTVYADDTTMEALTDWLAIRGDGGAALFTPILKGNKARTIEPKINTVKGLTAQAIYNILDKRGKEADVKNFSPHDFRRTYAGDMMDAGVDISTVSKMMGHANVETTGRYDRRGEEVKREAAKRRRFPYQRR